MVARGTTPEPGRWRSKPYQKPVLEAIGAPGVEQVLYLGASQGAGKTEILLNAIGYFVDVDPSPQIFVTYSVDMAKRVSKHRVAPMLRETEGLSAKVAEARSRDSGNTILDKEYEGGQLTLVGANSAAGLSMYPKRVALFDEVDRYPPSAGTEGDPVALAITRTSAFWNAVVVYATSPGTRQTSRAWRIWEQSDRQEWCLVCGDCGRAQVPKWSQVHWDKDEQGDAIEASAHYVCEVCGSCWNDAQRWAASRRGRYVAGTEFTGIRACRVNGLAVIGRTLKSIVRQWVQAHGNPEELKVFVNTVLCDWWDEDHAAKIIDETGLLPRREEIPERNARPVIPVGVAVLTAGVDVQDNRFEISVYGWGAGEESWLLRHEVIWGDPTTREGEVLAAAWSALDQWLIHPWGCERGGADFIRAGCVDTGGHHTQAAYDFCSPRYRRMTPDGGQTFLFATKGFAGPGELWPRAPSKATRKVPLWPIHVDAGKGQIYSRLGIAEAGPGFVHFPTTVDLEFFKGLTSEKLVQGRDKKGFPTLTWKLKRDGLRNEPLDCAVLAYAALQGLRANGYDLELGVAQLAQRVRWEPPSLDTPTAVASSAPPVPRREPQGGGGWLGDTRDWLRR